MTIYTESKVVYIDTIDMNLKTISICMYNYIFKDGVKIAEEKLPRRGFVPGQIDDLTAWIADCDDKDLVISVCNSMWTPEVVDMYSQKLAAQEAQLVE